MGNSLEGEPREERKTVLIVRLGAFGDMIQTTCVFPYWHSLGYQITLNCGGRALEIVKHNPYIEYVIPHKRDSVPFNELQGYWNHLGAKYDELCVLTGNVVEGQLLFPSNSFMWFSTDRHRRRAASRYNYCERMLEVAGFKPILPVRGELYFSKFEREWAKRLVKRELRKKYVLLWVHSGSSIHKSYAWYWHTIKGLLESWDDLFVITAGDEWCYYLDEELKMLGGERVLTTSGLWSIRQAMAIVPYVDIVVGPETGLLNAAGCYDVPKVCLLSHSSKDNLTKYWENDYSLQAPCECSPCHRLFKWKEDPDICEKGPLGHQICMEILPPEQLIEHIKQVRLNHGKTTQVRSKKTMGNNEKRKRKVHRPRR